ncbi:MAG: hypothetical protein FGM52_04210 [Mycobacterium sp.]|nr:hypothetical protein [Mycobacterium sp.]
MEQYTGTGWTQLYGNGWNSGVNTMIAYRNGLVVGLNNGAVEYWTPFTNLSSVGNDLYNATEPLIPMWQSASFLQQGKPQNSFGWTEFHDNTWDNAVTSMVQLGDGIALGLTSSSSSQNGTVEYLPGFGPASSSQAFGYAVGPNGPVEATPTIWNQNGWIEIAGNSDLSGNSANGSVQQLIPLSWAQLDPAGSGNLVQAQSLLVGQTNNGIYAWSGSTLNPFPVDIVNTSSPWQLLQKSDSWGRTTLSSTQLASAWEWITTANLPSFGNNTFGQSGLVGDPASDPVFGVDQNQAWCGSGCSGDFYSFALTYQPNGDGVLFSWPPDEGSGISADLNLEVAGYGYLFVPNGFWDKFKFDDYSLGLVLAAGGGPSLDLTLPSVSLSYGPKDFPVYTKTEPIDAGTLGTVTISTGITVGATAGANITPNTPITLAAAEFIPGIMLTWNVAGNPGNFGVSGAFTDNFTVASISELLADVENPSATASLTVSPYLNVGWGYTVPESVPFAGGYGLVDISMDYSNPVTLTGTAQLSDNTGNIQLQLTASGVLDLKAALLPGLTSALTWDDPITLYTWNDYLPSVNIPS